RELLVVSRWTGNHTHKAWGVLNDFLGSATELPVPQSAPAQRVQPLDCSNQMQGQSNAARIAAHDTVREPSWSITSVTAEARHIAPMTCTAHATEHDPTRVEGKDTPLHRAHSDLAMRTVNHGLREVA